LSPRGKITADDKGLTHFQADPAGRHRYPVLAEGHARARWSA
jgi:hypothetical protein